MCPTPCDAAETTGSSLALELEEPHPAKAAATIAASGRSLQRMASSTGRHLSVTQQTSAVRRRGRYRVPHLTPNWKERDLNDHE